MSETNREELSRLLRAAKIIAPEGMEVPPYQAEDRLHRAAQIGETILANPCAEIPSDEVLLRNLRRKREFIERYGPVSAPAKLPLTLRLSYDTFAQRDFAAGNPVELVFELFACAQELLREYTIIREPSSIVLSVYRPNWRAVYNRSIPSPTRPWEGSGKWVDFLDFRIAEETPFFSFEELELAHLELWPWLCDYARHITNPCDEIPLIEQNCGQVLPKR